MFNNKIYQSKQCLENPTLTIVTGTPRSGTTWMHNTLIDVGRFHGIPADDLLEVDRNPYRTDENLNVHDLLISRSSEQDLFSGLGTICRKIAEKHEKNGELMLKSPYYSFYLYNLDRSGLCDRFVYIKRDSISIAISMLRHPHISTLLKGPYRSFYDIKQKHEDTEALRVPQGIVDLFVQRFEKLTVFDRALFKVICFVSSFVFESLSIASDKLFIFDYDAYKPGGDDSVKFSKFMRLTDCQARAFDASFRVPSSPTRALPEHSAEFMEVILGFERKLWRMIF